MVLALQSNQVQAMEQPLTSPDLKPSGIYPFPEQKEALEITLDPSRLCMSFLIPSLFTFARKHARALHPSCHPLW